MQRVRWNRYEGKKLPPNTKYVGRCKNSKYGNPYKVEDYGREECIALYTAWLRGKLEEDKTFLEPLEGYDLACTCHLDEHCHADILLQVMASDLYKFEKKMSFRDPAWQLSLEKWQNRGPEVIAAESAKYKAELEANLKVRIAEAIEESKAQRIKEEAEALRIHQIMEAIPPFILKPCPRTIGMDLYYDWIAKHGTKPRLSWIGVKKGKDPSIRQAPQVKPTGRMAIPHSSVCGQEAGICEECEAIKRYDSTPEIVCTDCGLVDFITFSRERDTIDTDNEGYYHRRASEKKTQHEEILRRMSISEHQLANSTILQHEYLAAQKKWYNVDIDIHALRMK